LFNGIGAGAVDELKDESGFAHSSVANENEFAVAGVTHVRDRKDERNGQKNKGGGYGF
jgi:hypothetical protein